MTNAEAIAVWNMAYKFWPDGSVFRYFARNPKTEEVFGMAVTTPGELAAVATYHDYRGYNSYWQPNPTRKRHGTRCTTDDITHWQWFMVDIDPLEERASPNWVLSEIYNRALSDTLETVIRFDPLVISSGRGVQMLYPMQPEPLDLWLGHATIRDVAPRVMTYWLDKLNAYLENNDALHGCIVDVSCTDFPRVMRLPYTINQKTGVRALMGQVPAIANGGMEHMLLEHMLLSKAPPELLEQPWVPTLSPKIVTAWPEYLPNLTVGARIFLTEGMPASLRHKGATAAMLSLIEAGATKEQVLEALHYGAGLCQPPLRAADVEDMVRRRFRKG